MTCPLCNLDPSKDHFFYEDDKISIVRTLNQKGHAERFMGVYKLHVDDAPKEIKDHTDMKLMEFGITFFKKDFVIMEDTHSKIIGHWYRVCSDFDGDDFLQILDTEYKLVKLWGDWRIQENQYKRWWNWKKKEGAIHQPTHPETYQEPCQIRRINWIKEQCKGTRNILEVGCSNGYILEQVRGMYGMDVNEEVIKENRIRRPDILWFYGDAEIIPFSDETMEIVLLPDCIEHNSYRKAIKMVKEAIRVAKKKVLITTPNGFDVNRNQRNWQCFKHVWVMSKERLADFVQKVGRMQVEYDDAFLYLVIQK